MELIDRENYCKNICRCGGLENGCDKEKCQIWNAPTIEATPVRHGRYISDYKHYGLVGNCSECGTSVKFSDNFCPNCGARMDGGQAPGEG